MGNIYHGNKKFGNLLETKNKCQWPKTKLLFY